MTSTMTAPSTQLRSFQGMRATALRPVQAKVIVPRMARRTAQVTRCSGFIGSANNLIMVASTTAFLVAGRFGLAPTANRQASAGLKLNTTNASGLKTGDPAGFTAVDVLALGAFGHAIGAGIILGLKNQGIIP
ncbi:hypothetical protein WJX72_010135 [[Myrmecia] bisecta]|uniref:PSI-K n=1 Tax=[Myrmecia] bisecta TaxID=41462 RepID=A0AAW1PTU5_9CHLO